MMAIRKKRKTYASHRWRLHLLSGIFKAYIVFLLVIKTVIGGADIDSLLQKRLVPQSLDIPRIRQRMLFIIPVASIDVLDLKHTFQRQQNLRFILIKSHVQPSL